MTDELDDILDSVFHGCAVAAWVEQAGQERHCPPDSEATRQRAYRYYEEELAAKNAAKGPVARVHLAAPAGAPAGLDTSR